MAKNTGLVSKEQREYYASWIGSELPEGITWEELTPAQQSILSSDDISGQMQGSQAEAIVNSPTLADNLYNFTPAQLTTLNNALRADILAGNDGVFDVYAKVREAINDKLTYYANGEINIPIEWENDMGNMIAAAQEKLPARDKYIEQPVTVMNSVSAQNISNDAELLKKQSLQDLAKLQVTMNVNMDGFNADNVSKEIGERLEKIAKMGKKEFLNKEDFASVSVLLDTVPMSSRREGAGHDFEVFTAVERKLDNSRNFVNKSFTDLDMTAVAAKSQDRLSAFVKSYDEDNHLDNVSHMDVQRINSNAAVLDTLGKSSLEKVPYQEKAVETLSHDEAEAVLGKLRKGKNVDPQDLAALIVSNVTGTSGPDFDLVSKQVAYQVGRIKKNSDVRKSQMYDGKVVKTLPKGNFSSYDVILEAASRLPEAQLSKKDYQKAVEKLKASRQIIAKNPQPKYEEMEEAISLLDKLEITDGFQLGKRAKSKDSDNIKAMFVEAMKIKTKQDLMTSQGAEITEEDFNLALAANIVAGLGGAAVADALVVDDPKKLDNFAKQKEVRISKEAMLGYLAAESRKRESFASRLEKKAGPNDGSGSLRKNNKELDGKLAQKCPKRYAALKAIGVSLGWSGAYWLAASTCGPAGVAAVATASGVYKTVGLIKQYKKEKAELKSKGKKMEMTKFLKKNWLSVAGVGLTAMGAAMSVSNAAIEMGVQINPEMIEKLKSLKYASGVSLGLAATAKSYKQARKNGASVIKALGACSISGLSTAAAVVWGNANNESEKIDMAASEQDLSALTAAQDLNVQDALAQEIGHENMGFYDQNHNGIPDMVEQNDVFNLNKQDYVDANGMLDRDADGISDYIDRDAGNGMLDRDNDGISDYVDRDAGDGSANPVPESEKSEVETQSEPEEKPGVEHTPEKDKLYNVTLDGSKDFEGLQAAEKPALNLDSLHEQVAENKIYGIEDPNSHQVVEFQIDDEGRIHTLNGQDIQGSKELHDAMVARVAQGEGNLSDNELAYLKHNMSQDTFNEVKYADSALKSVNATENYLAQDKAIVDDIKNNSSLNGGTYDAQVVPDGEKTEVTAPAEKTGNEGATAEVQQPAAPEKAEVQSSGETQHDSSVKEKVEAVYQRDVAELSQNGIPLDAGDKLNNGEMMVSDDGKGTETFVGKDAQGNAFKIISHDGAKGNFTEIEVAKDHPMYEKLNSSDESEAAFAKMDFLQEVQNGDYKTVTPNHLGENITTSSNEQAPQMAANQPSVEKTGNEEATAEVQQPAAPEKAENGNLASAQTSGKGGVQARVSSLRGMDKPSGTTMAQNTTKIMTNANIGMMGRNPHDDNSYG